MNFKLLNFTKATLAISFALGPISAYAEDASAGLNGCYNAVRGHVETLSISQTQQLGTYRIVLKRDNWASLREDEQSYTIKRFVAAGPILGTINSVENTGQATLNHVISDKERRGLFLSQNDVFIPTAPPEFCNNEGGYILTGIENVSIVAGTGIFAGLVPQQGTPIQVEGTFNSCSGQNDFEVIDGQVCFQK